MSRNPEEIIERAEELCFLCEEEEAERLVRDALDRKPEHLGLQTELAIILSRQGYDAKAETILRKVVKQDPYYERAVASLGRLLDSSLRTEEAEALFLTFLKKRPQAHIVFDDLCRLWLDNEEEERALVEARHHVEEYSEDFHAYDALRYLLARIEDDLEEEMVDDPASKNYLNALGENIVEQYSIIMKLKEKAIGSEESSMLIDDLEEDLTRIIAELKALRKRYVELKVPLPKVMTRVLANLPDEK